MSPLVEYRGKICRQGTFEIHLFFFRRVNKAQGLSMQSLARDQFKTIIDELFVTGKSCLLYTSDAADERSSVDLGGRRIIKKKKNDSVTSVQQCKIKIKY